MVGSAVPPDVAGGGGDGGEVCAHTPKQSDNKTNVTDAKSRDAINAPNTARRAATRMSGASRLSPADRSMRREYDDVNKSAY